MSVDAAPALVNTYCFFDKKRVIVRGFSISHKKWLFLGIYKLPTPKNLSETYKLLLSSETDLGLLQHPKWSLFAIIINSFTVNDYHKAFHLGCWSSPRSPSAYKNHKNWIQDEFSYFSTMTSFKMLLWCSYLISVLFALFT